MISLYIHFPWCVRKCPYCDFNSHAVKDGIPEKAYIERLIADFDNDIQSIDASISTIFMGGGTPSLFSPDSLKYLLTELRARADFTNNIEITLEANPGTVEQSRFIGFREAGINRLSLGIQSFDDAQLKTLGRIHSSEEARAAITAAKHAGFDNFNLDIMYALPNQPVQNAIDDLQQAIKFSPTHISWYQLTLEPNTLFYKQRPTLPDDELSFQIMQQGHALLKEHGYAQYEVSAYARNNQVCQHNLNYWTYQDYIGIGAGAHGKLTDDTGNIIRTVKHKHPKTYLTSENFSVERKRVETNNLAFEFMLNALRLQQPISLTSFEMMTYLPIASIEAPLKTAVDQNLIEIRDNKIIKTKQGELFLNDLVSLFL